MVLVVVFGWSSGGEAAPIEWTVASGGNGHFYEAVDLGTGISWEDAKANAEAAGGYLATVTSAAEDSWLTANLLPLVTGVGGGNRLGPWLGGYQDTSSPSFSEPSGGWTWVTGELWSYTAWETGEPQDGAGPPDSENYLHYYVGGTLQGWNDNRSVAPQIGSYIIETAPIPEPTTALLLTLGLAGLGMRRRVR